MPVALSIRGLVKRWRVGVRGCSITVDVLSGVDIELPAGEVLGIGGRPGSGKSTLLACAAGLARPDAGSVEWFGSRSVVGDEPAPPVAGVAYVAERTAYYAFLTVREALEYYAISRDIPGRERAADVARALERVALADDRDTPVARLGALAHRRLAIAQALLARPRLLIIDDVFTAVNEIARTELVALVRSLHDDDVTVVAASRDERALRLLTNRLAVLERGQLVAPAQGSAPLSLTALRPATRVAEGRR